MKGWISLAIIVLVELTIAGLLVRVAVRRWWDWIAIGLLTALLILPCLNLITGDVSRLLPEWVWSSNSADAKDQIIWASVASTFLVPLIGAACCVLIGNRTWRAIRAARDTRGNSRLSPP